MKLPEDFVDYTYSEEMKTATTFLLENLPALSELEIRIDPRRKKILDFFPANLISCCKKIIKLSLIGDEFINERSQFTFCLPGAVQELKNLQVFKFNNWVMND